jgi:endonuclease YncB( thermonuclease family)
MSHCNTLESSYYHKHRGTPAHRAYVNRIRDVVRTNDGDTIRVVCGDVVETVRLIGVDTPETKEWGIEVECYGTEAADFTTAC